MFSRIFWCYIFIVSCRAAPADNPVRVDLPVYDQPNSDPDVSLANPLEIENHPSPIRQNGLRLNGIFGHKEISGNKFDISTPKVGSINYGRGPFSDPIPTLEGALLETEYIGSKTLSVHENIQGIVAGLLQPSPIVDTINEEDKYGNSGDKFYSAGRAIVSGASGVSNFVNSILELPGAFITKITRAATEKLNNFGGKLIGL